MLTNHGLNTESSEGTELHMARQRFDRVRSEWASACELMSKFAEFDDWEQLRAGHDDNAIVAMFETLLDATAELNSLLIGLQPLHKTAERGRKEWAVLKEILERCAACVITVCVCAS